MVPAQHSLQKLSIRSLFKCVVIFNDKTSKHFSSVLKRIVYVKLLNFYFKAFDGKGDLVAEIFVPGATKREDIFLSAENFHHFSRLVHPAL